MRIIAPVSVTGVWASVKFTNGVGETDDLSLIEWFKNHGYKIEGEPPMPVEPLEIVEVVEEIEDEPVIMGKPNFEEMTPLEIREWAKENGYGGKIKNTRSKDKLIEILRK